MVLPCRETIPASPIFTDDPTTIVDHCWFRGGWWDPFTMAWNTVKEGRTKDTAPVDKGAPGASVFVPLSLGAGAAKTIRVMLSWYSPHSTLHIGHSLPSSDTYQPWYSAKFADIFAVADYWRNNYADLQHKTTLFKEAFHSSTLPPEVIEAVAANLTILKSPTTLTTNRWPFLGLGRLRGRPGLLQWLLYPCMELCTGHVSSVPRFGTFHAAYRIFC